jgi:DNA polymerase beta
LPLPELPGVGHKIATKIQQILDTNGQLRQLDEAKLDPNVIAMNTLAGVAGVGHVLARKLVYEDGIMSVEELKNVPGLHNQVQIGLKYYDDFRQRIPRDEMDMWNDIILSVRDNVDTALVVNVCGSYRRGLPTSGDVDILVTHPNFTISQKEQGETFNIVERIVDALKDAGTITDDISIGPLKYMGVGKLQGGTVARRIDIKLLPRESYYAGLLHFTGSAEYNRQMRSALQCQLYVVL